ncbi:MAG: hypothetical protein IBX55_22370 [Methyloprofundus sp.]|nr:hypothetical protein [Methyloprofundus sp.]
MTISKHISHTGINIFARLMGLMVAAFAVEFIANGRFLLDYIDRIKGLSVLFKFLKKPCRIKCLSVLT